MASNATPAPCSKLVPEIATSVPTFPVSGDTASTSGCRPVSGPVLSSSPHPIVATAASRASIPDTPCPVMFFSMDLRLPLPVELCSFDTAALRGPAHPSDAPGAPSIHATIGSNVRAECMCMWCARLGGIQVAATLHFCTQSPHFATRRPGAAVTPFRPARRCSRPAPRARAWYVPRSAARTRRRTPRTGPGRPVRARPGRPAGTTRGPP